MKRRRVYEEVRGLVKDLGGKMFHQRSGYQWGAWIVRLNGKERVFRSNGSGYPELERLYQLKPNAKLNHWSDFTNTLLPGAREKLVDLISNQDDEASL